MRTTAKMGLTSWDQPTDPYNYAQLAGNWQIVDYHDHSPGRGVPIAAGGLAPGAVLSTSIAQGVVSFQHLGASLAQDLGLNANGVVGRGYVSIPTSQSTSSTTFTYLATADEVTNVAVAAGGLIHVAYQATWSSTVAAAGTAAIFLGANQLVAASAAGGAPAVQQAVTTGTTALALATAPGGLVSGTSGTYSGNVTTGQVVGVGSFGYTTIFAAAGTYNVGVQFKASSGSVTVLNRQLWVWSENFS